MARTIISVGTSIPGGDVETIDYSSSRSLLDADIVVFSPEIPFGKYETERYQGRVCLSDDASFRAKQAIAHWRRELGAALDAGKLIVVLLNEPDIVFAATGEKQYSGTGRNARATRLVGELSSYEVFQVSWKFLPATGSEMVLTPDAKFLLPFWSQFSDLMEYQLYLGGEIKEPILKTKSGGRVVGACIRRGKGALVAIPPVDFEDPAFTETRGEGAKAQEYWTDKAESFGKRFIAALCAMASSLAAEVAVTPPPDWAQQDEFRLPEEESIRVGVDEATRQLAELDVTKRVLEDKLLAAGSLRALLYEQGKPLESAVLEALQIFGFQAAGHNEGGSEFDAVFSSTEGRFLGEVEGKDSRSINIDKFSQLERNLSEDFQRDEVAEHAKGVLFGNAFRLQPPQNREQPFTAKCLAAAKRLGVALISTPDMFEPARYLKSHDDVDYAAACRKAIFETSGQLVVFPAVSEST